MTTPDLRSYDVILVNSSGGKDSQAMLDLVVEHCRRQAWDLRPEDLVRRIVVVHADLGRVEWAGTRELAQLQAEHYGLPFETVSRPQGDLLTQVEQRHASLIRRGKVAAPWPSPARRWCTSDHKRGQVRRLMTRLTDERRAMHRLTFNRNPPTPCRILNCLGLRADESPARRKLEAFVRDEGASNGKREVDAWLPIHDWTVDEVWARIHASGVPYHPAYDLGMGRLSCCLCIYAPRAQLALAIKHNRALTDEYIAVEQRTGYAFRQDVSLSEIAARIDAGDQPQAGADDGAWNM